jgi:hypothetical protein
MTILPDRPADQIARFDMLHGIGSYEKCAAAANRLLRVSRVLTPSNLNPYRLEREGIPADVVAAFVALLRGPPQEMQRARRGPSRRD